MEKTIASGKTGTSRVWISGEIPGMAARIEIAGSVLTAPDGEKKWRCTRGRSEAIVLPAWISAIRSVPMWRLR